MNRKLFITTLFASLASLSALPSAAQELHKEITVEQEIVPTKRDASRMNVLPTVSLPAVQVPALQYSSRAVTSNVPAALTVLEPVGWGDRLFVPDSTSRGYAQLGFVPLANTTFSAGYRILSLPNTHLKVWGEYNGALYHPTKKLMEEITYDESNPLLRDHTATFGTAFGHSFSRTSKIEGTATYTYDYHNLLSPRFFTGLPAHRVDASASFHQETARFNYRTGVGYNYFGFGNPHYYHIVQLIDVANTSPLPYGIESHTARQHMARAFVGGDMQFDEQGRLDLNLDVTTLTSAEAYTTPTIDQLFKSYNLFNPYQEFNLRKAHTTALVTFTPAYTMAIPQGMLRIGAKVDAVVNGGKALRFAPDITTAWTPWQMLGFEFKATGGSTLNPLADLYAETPYLERTFTYGASETPYILDGKIVAGPFHGAYIEALVSHAVAKKWLMPVGNLIDAGGAVFTPYDIKGTTLGGALGYTFRRLLSLRAEYRTFVGEENITSAYYLWRDRARHVVDFTATVNPIADLKLTLGYQFRGDRTIYTYDSEAYYQTSLDGRAPQRNCLQSSLGCISDLNLGADYALTPRVNIWARGQNLLNRRYANLGAHQAQGINALIGVSARF